MKYHLFQSSSDQFTTNGTTTLITAICSTQVTRQAIEASELLDDIKSVIGWVDISSPNLVDLIDELAKGPGGSKLGGLRVELGIHDVQNVPVQRGLSVINEAGLDVLFEPKKTDVTTAQHLRSIGARSLPDLTWP